MTTTRTLCPLCDWHHDQDDDLDIPPAITVDAEILASGDLVAIASAVAHQTMAARLGEAEDAVRAHLETHELIEWVTAVTTAQRRATAAEGAVERVRAFADADQDGICCSHVQGDLRRILRGQP